MKGKFWKRAFTMTELLVVVGISAVLVGVGIVATTEIIKSVDMTEQDEQARMIYYAASNQATELTASGAWDENYKKNFDNGDYNWGTKVKSLMPDGPSDYGYMLEETGITDNEDKYERAKWDAVQDEMYFIEYNTGSEPDTTQLISSMCILEDLLPPGACDDELRTEHTYIIEYNRKTGVIYAVWQTSHTDDNDKFTAEEMYEALDAAGRPGYDVTSDSAKHARMGFQNSEGIVVRIGYYVSLGSTRTDTETEGLLNIDVSVENGEELKLIILDPNTKSYSGNMNSKIYITIMGDLTGSTNPVYMEASSATTTKIYCDSSGNYTTKKNLTIEETEEGLKYTVLLDSIAVKQNASAKDTYNIHFSSVCPGIIPGDNLTIRVRCSSDTKLVTPAYGYAATNSLFDFLEDKKAGISAMRHLENLSPEISDVARMYSGNEVQNMVTSAVLENDISWNGKLPDGDTGYSYLERCTTYYTGDRTNLVYADEGSYIPVTNENLTDFDGGNHIIYNLYIKGKEVTELGVFGTFKGNISNLGVAGTPSTYVCTYEGTGMIGGIAGNFSDGVCDNCFANVKITAK